MQRTRLLGMVSIVLLAFMSCAGNNDHGSYWITYNGNGNTGGTAPVDATEYGDNDSIDIMYNTGRLVKAGLCYNGWNTTADRSGSHYAEGGTIPNYTSDVLLYAEWVNLADIVDFDSATGTITFYHGVAKDVEFPESIGGVAVSYIGHDSFSFFGLTSLSLPSTLLGIDDRAFNDNDLTTLVLPENVTYIGDHAFYENALTSVTFSADLQTIYERAFAGNKLTTLDLSVSTGDIRAGAFDGNPIVHITIGDTVTISDTVIDEDDGHNVYAMGIYGDTFRTSYNLNGAGTYSYSGGPWTFTP